MNPVTRDNKLNYFLKDKLFVIAQALLNPQMALYIER